MRFYHGTTKSAAAAIKADKRGLLPGSWVTTNQEFAEHYAAVKAAAEEDEPVVMEFDLDPETLLPGGLQLATAREFMVAKTGGTSGTITGTIDASGELERPTVHANPSKGAIGADAQAVLNFGTVSTAVHSNPQTPMASAPTIHATNPGIMGLPEGAWSEWSDQRLVKHFVERLAGRHMTRREIARSIGNLIRWNKRQNPELSKKAARVFKKYRAIVGEGGY